MAITITIDEDDFLDMLVDRVKSWTDDENIIELFEQYYDHMVYGGCFEGTSRSIAEIVDNDYVNNTSVITEEEFDEARQKYIQEELEEDTPTWEGLEAGEELPDFIDGYMIEAKTDSCMLVSW